MKLGKTRCACMLAALMPFLVGCGGGGGSSATPFPQVVSVTFNPSAATYLHPPTCTVTLDRPAPQSPDGGGVGIAFTYSANDTLPQSSAPVLLVKPNVDQYGFGAYTVVPGGQTQATFPVAVQGVSAPINIVVSAATVDGSGQYQFASSPAVTVSPDM